MVKKHKAALQLAFVVVLIIGLFIGIFLAQQRQELRKKAAVACPTTSDSIYNLVDVTGIPAERPDYLDADVNFSLRGYDPASEAVLGLVRYGGQYDPDAPQLSRLFADNRAAEFTGAYQVYGWVWDVEECGGERYGCKGPILYTPWQANVAVVDMLTEPGEEIYLPARETGILGNYKALVLYAEESRITFVYTREDTVANGYAVHLENICVDPNLLSLYQSRVNGEGNRIIEDGLKLPGLRNNDSLGIVPSDRVTVSIRDRGSFMDPRSVKDWWQRPGTLPTSTPTSTPEATPTPSPLPSPTETPGVSPTPTPSPTATPPSTGSPTPTPTSTPEPTPNPGDVDGDGKVDIVDIGIIVDDYGLSPPTDERADLNGDDIVNIVDIGIVVTYFGQ